jgi:putative ABC transport system substrate-binding protein
LCPAAARLQRLRQKLRRRQFPIVFMIAADPVRAGLVRNLNRPEENITGVVKFTDVLITKRLEMLIELVPNARVVGALINPSNPNSKNGRMTWKRRRKRLDDKFD